MNAVTKSWANDFHGTVFEFVRNKGLNASNFFNPVVNGDDGLAEAGVQDGRNARGGGIGISRVSIRGATFCQSSGWRLGSWRGGGSSCGGRGKGTRADSMDTCALTQMGTHSDRR